MVTKYNPDKKMNIHDQKGGVRIAVQTLQNSRPVASLNHVGFFRALSIEKSFTPLLSVLHAGAKQYVARAFFFIVNPSGFQVHKSLIKTKRPTPLHCNAQRSETEHPENGTVAPSRVSLSFQRTRAHGKALAELGAVAPRPF